MNKIKQFCPKVIPKRLVIILILITLFSVRNWAQDEFLPVVNQPENRQELKDSTKSNNSDEFGNFELSDSTSFAHTECGGNCKKEKGENLSWVIGILAATILAGIFVRFRATRNFRGVFLLLSIAILGFYKGACPCPISSMQNLVLAGLGTEVPWQSMVWFLGLIPVTFLFGRVYCGWICHLGALQEFIFLPAKIKLLQGTKAQKIMRFIRIVFLVALIIQLFVTRTNIFKHYDPFKTAFNLIATNTLSWILFGLTMISSVFIYRPFCKTVCPVGLILGWVNKIPGASVIGNNGSCTGCKTCDNQCRIRAITRDDKFSKLDNQECIACGECIGGCNKSALRFFRNNKNTHHDKINCK